MRALTMVLLQKNLPFTSSRITTNNELESSDFMLTELSRNLINNFMSVLHVIFKRFVGEAKN